MASSINAGASTSKAADEPPPPGAIAEEEHSRREKLRHKLAHPDGHKGMTDDRVVATAGASLLVLMIFIGPWLFSSLGGWSLFGRGFSAVGRGVQRAGFWLGFLPAAFVLGVIVIALWLAVSDSPHIHAQRNKFKLHNLLPRRRNHRYFDSKAERRRQAQQQPHQE